MMISGVSHIYAYIFSIKVQLRSWALTRTHRNTCQRTPWRQTWLIFCGIDKFVQCYGFSSSSSDYFSLFRKRNNGDQASNLTMGHFDNIWCRYKRYYFGKTLKCEIKSYSLGCCRNVSVALAQPRWRWELLFKFNLNHHQLDQMVEVKFKSSLEQRIAREASLRACMS